MKPTFITRTEAKKLGLKHYNGGCRCKHAHHARRRFVSDGNCCQCARLALNRARRARSMAKTREREAAEWARLFQQVKEVWHDRARRFPATIIPERYR